MVTELIRGIHNLQPRHLRCVATIGNFDGVHLGHQALLRRLKEIGQQHGLPVVVITFEPQPQEFFMPQQPIARLTRLREKFFYLRECGVDRVLVLKFDAALASLTAEDFIRHIVINGLGAKYVIVGDDFRFGARRQGNFALLENMAQQYGFIAESMPTLLLRQERVSSTRVRRALQLGDHELVHALLGHPYAMMGRVTHGDKRGRHMGFPTANIYLHRAMTAVSGVYVVKMHLLQKNSAVVESYAGVANVGNRPTVCGQQTLLEVHLFEFKQNIYGRHVIVEFCKKLRAEERFPNVELLIQQMHEDAKQAREYFNL